MRLLAGTYLISAVSGSSGGGSDSDTVTVPADEETEEDFNDSGVGCAA
jgi:hypothetical protein